MVRALLGGHAGSIAKAVLKIGDVREAIVTQILGTLNDECGKLCQRKCDTSSLFRSIPYEELDEFKWENMVAELQLKAPLLYRVLHSLASRNDHRNVVKVGAAHFPGICSSIAILLKERNREMCGLQSLISLLMFSCHCEKQVCFACYRLNYLLWFVYTCNYGLFIHVTMVCLYM